MESVDNPGNEITVPQGQGSSTSIQVVTRVNRWIVPWTDGPSRTALEYYSWKTCYSSIRLNIRWLKA